jgi:aminoglycoside phosphotransferase (APT) family kinase protein
LLVLEPLISFLRESGIDAPEDLAPVRVGEGHSNVTFLLSIGVILRRPPRGPLPPSAHDVLREACLLRALEPTPVRSPKVLAVCDDNGVIGAPFYVMEEIKGEVLTSSIPAALDTPEQHARIADELINALVELHEVDWVAVGLNRFGKPNDYLERQLTRFLGLWAINKTRNIEEIETVGDWLSQNMPVSPAATIVHGDYRLGNTMLAATAPARLEAILDWELATIGDPLADVGYMAVTWNESGDRHLLLNFQSVTTRSGFPSRAELIRRYEQRSGRSMQALNWYTTLALWKAAVFMEGNYKRALAGTTDDPYLKSAGDGVVELARRAVDLSKNGF